MTTLNPKRRMIAIATMGLCFGLITGCRSAGYSSTTSESGFRPFPFYQAAPKPEQPYSEEISQPPSTQPTPPAILPVPGYSDPDVPPSPSAQRSKRNLTPSSFKFPALSRPANEVRQMAARTSGALGWSALKNRLGGRLNTTGGEQEAMEGGGQPEVPSLHETPEIPTSMNSVDESTDDSASTVYPKAVRSRPRNHRRSLTGGRSESDMPHLTPPSQLGDSGESEDSPPRLLVPNN